MTRSDTQTEQGTTKEETSIWTRAFDEVQRARDTNTAPNPEVFRDLTKSAGGD